MIKKEEEEEELKQYFLTHIKKDKRKSKKFKLKDGDSKGDNLQHKKQSKRRKDNR